MIRWSRAMLLEILVQTNLPCDAGDGSFTCIDDVTEDGSIEEGRRDGNAAVFSSNNK